MPEDPDTTLRAVEFQATIGTVKRLTDGSASLYVKSQLEFSVAKFWPFNLLQHQPASVLITPELIGESAETVRPQGKKGGSASQQQRFLIEAIAEANGVQPDKVEAYYQKRLKLNCQRLQKELETAQAKEF